MDDKAEIIQFAKDYSIKHDLYALLNVSPDTPSNDIHRAWRKASLKHHPDKAKNFDPELWQLYERARDVLVTAEARAVYDGARAASLKREQERAAMDAKRRRAIEDLERREFEASEARAGRFVAPRTSNGTAGRNEMSEAERRNLMERGNKRRADRQRMMAEAEARDQERERERVRLEKEQQKGKEMEDAREKPTKQPPFSFGSPKHPPPATEINVDQHPPAPDGDGYDEREAELERRLQEVRKRKADKEARRAAKKGKKNDGTEEPRPVPTPEPAPSRSTTTSSKPINVAPVPPGKTSFAPIMARLRAAQAEKDRKKAEAEAAATTGTAATAAHQ
ncbi:hypothetical protein F5Y15DRAFT_142363 [Xylariaceae sp. FL0016]|nr:hypothetical protein F5Y15DRAFT_142363 [Xylariaceae sp. FL0016]